MLAFPSFSDLDRRGLDCGSGRVPCKYRKMCISEEDVCNGENDCRDSSVGSDEEGCTGKDDIR